MAQITNRIIFVIYVLRTRTCVSDTTRTRDTRHDKIQKNKIRGHKKQYFIIIIIIIIIINK